MSEFVNPWQMARVLSARIPRPCPSTVRMHVVNEFGRGPKREDIERMMAKIDEARARCAVRERGGSWGHGYEPADNLLRYEKQMAQASAKMARALQEVKSLSR